MFRRATPDVVVIGAGPVGLFGALVLARRGIRTEVIDERFPGRANPHPVALHPSSLELLEEYGLSSKVLERAERVDTIRVFTGTEQSAEIRLSSLPTRFPFVAVLPTGELEQILEQALAREKIKVQWNHRLSQVTPSSEGASLTIDRLVLEMAGYAVAHYQTLIEDSRSVMPTFVLAADGSESLARRQMDIGFDAVRPSERYAVFELDAPLPTPGEMRILLGEGTTDFCWPLPGGGSRWSFQLLDDVAPSTFGIAPSPTDADREQMARLVRERAPWFHFDPRSLHRSGVVRIEYRLASDFGEGPVWLAGDAGHTTSWGAEQSMNVGLREAAELANIYADALGGKASNVDPSDYGRARRAEWQDLLEDRRPMEDASTPSWIARRARHIVPNLPASGRHLARMLESLGLRFST